MERVASLADLRPGEGRLATVAGREIALFRTAVGVRAVDARCPHAGGPLHEGIVSGTRVTCPLHLRAVDLDSGEVEDWEERVRCYPVVTDGEAVLVEVEGRGP